MFTLVNLLVQRFVMFVEVRLLLVRRCEGDSAHMRWQVTMVKIRAKIEEVLGAGVS